MVSALIL